MMGSPAIRSPGVESCESFSWFAEVPPAVGQRSGRVVFAKLTSMETQHRRMPNRCVVVGRYMEEVLPTTRKCAVDLAR